MSTRLTFACLFLIAAACLALPAGAQTAGGSRAYPGEISRPVAPFTFDLLSFAPSRKTDQADSTNQDSVRVDLYLAVPYESLTFLYAGDRYVADYGVVIQVSDPDRPGLLGGMGGRLLLDRYKDFSVVESTSEHEAHQEHGEEMADAEQFTFNLPAGRTYTVRLALRDLSSQHETDSTVQFSTPSFATSHPNLSDLMIYRARRGSHIVPLIGGDVGRISGNAKSGLFAEFYAGPQTASRVIDQAPTTNEAGLVTEVFAVNESGDLSSNDPVLKVSSSVTLTGAHAQPIFQDVDFEDLWFGRYLLLTYVLPSVQDTSLSARSDLERRALAKSERPIHVSIQRGIPITASDLDQAIQQLQIISTGFELDSLLAAQTPKEKRNAIVEFWRSRNADPDARYNRPMEIFYQRVKYANDHFGSGSREGWRSDRGRVYIQLGPPDFIDSHPYEATRKPYEVWDYSRLGVRYYFVDEYMLNDYRLVSPAPEPGTFLY